MIRHLGCDLTLSVKLGVLFSYRAIKLQKDEAADQRELPPQREECPVNGVQRLDESIF